jgi:hypothetical protein
LSSRRHTSANNSSVRPSGGAYSDSNIDASGAGSALRSTFPVAVSGRLSSTTKADGTM